LVAAAKLLVAATKNLFVVPNFVAVTKQFFRDPSLYKSKASDDKTKIPQNLRPKTVSQKYSRFQKETLL